MGIVTILIYESGVLFSGIWTWMRSTFLPWHSCQEQDQHKFWHLNYPQAQYLMELRPTVKWWRLWRRWFTRNRMEHCRRNPKILSELKIEGEWTETSTSEWFLFPDSGPESRSLVVAFASKTGLRHLARQNVCYMDGNFSLAPKIVYSMYISLRQN